MNILREVRRVRKKSLPIRVILLLTFCVIFVASTYAWFSTQKNVTFRGLEADVTPWDVSYYVEDNEVFNENVTFTIEELYPGMPQREEFVHIYNRASTSTDIKYQVVSVKVFGQEVLNELDIGIDGKTTNIFSADTNYPFKVSYTYDKNYLTGEYIDDETTPLSYATFNFTVNWDYEGNSEIESENLAKDILDTKFGKDAYAYYQDEENDPTKAIEVTVKITSKMIHPSTEGK